MAQTDRIILHWLNQSRSHRIVWLFEELNLEYEVKIYKRNKEFRAPKELEKVHPLGKSPVVEIIRNGSTKPLVLAETGHIIQYILANYDHGNKLIPAAADDKELVDYYLHFTEASLQGFLVSLLVSQMARQKAPWGSGFLVRAVTNGINSKYAQPELFKALKFLDNQLAEKPNKLRFVGDQLTGADIILSFPIVDNLFSDPERAATLGGNINIVKEFPHLHAWSESVKEVPSYAKADQVIEAKLGDSKL